MYPADPDTPVVTDNSIPSSRPSRSVEPTSGSVTVVYAGWPPVPVLLTNASEDPSVGLVHSHSPEAELNARVPSPSSPGASPASKTPFGVESSQPSASPSSSVSLSLGSVPVKYFSIQSGRPS